MFIVVVLPQPDGPSSAMKEPCSATRSRSWTASTSPKCFVRRSSLISAIVCLPLDGAEREAADQVALDQEPEDRRRDDQQQARAACRPYSLPDAPPWSDCR